MPSFVPASSRDVASDSSHSAPSSDSSPSDAELLAKARDGNQWAFKRLVERYEDQVAATVVGMLGPGPEADDVGQETFIRFYEAMDDFRGEASLGTYLTRIAINQSLKALRKRKRWYDRFLSRDDEETFVDEPAVAGGDAVDQTDRSEWIHRALQELSEHHRSVIVLRLLQGYSTKETAEVLDVPEGTVMSRLYRATNRLEDLLGSLIER